MVIGTAASTYVMDWGATAAWIALAVAIVSPLFTVLINNIHESKIKKLEILEQHGLDVIEQYIAITSREILTTGISDEYKKFYAKIFLYVPSSLHRTLEELNSLICNCKPYSFPDEEACQKLLIIISKSLNYNKL